MPDENIVKFNYDEDTALLIKEIYDNYKVELGSCLDFLIKGLKSSFLFPTGEDSYRARYEQTPESEVIVIEYEDVYSNNYAREELVITNRDFEYAAVFLYFKSRKFANDFWDTADSIRSKFHANAESRLYDGIATAVTRYALPLVRRTIATSVLASDGIGDASRPYMLALYTADTENYIRHNTAYGEGPIRIGAEPIMEQFIRLINGKSNNTAPTNIGFLTNLLAALRLNSAKFAQFFENEREETLGETVSRTED